MPFSYWFVLFTVHIALPAALCFVVIFYTWRFFAFIRRKFIEFRHRVDGYDKVDRRPQRRNSTRRPSRAELEEMLTSSFYIKPMTVKGQRSDYEAHFEYKSKYQPVSLDEKVQSEGFQVLKSKGKDEFYKWFTERMAARRYSNMTYTSLKSIKDQLRYYTRGTFSDASDIFRESNFATWCLFLELNILEDRNHLTWIQELPKQKTFNRKRNPM